MGLLVGSIFGLLFGIFGGIDWLAEYAVYGIFAGFLMTAVEVMFQ